MTFRSANSRLCEMMVNLFHDSIFFFFSFGFSPHFCISFKIFLGKQFSHFLFPHIPVSFCYLIYSIKAENAFGEIVLFNINVRNTPEGEIGEDLLPFLAPYNEVNKKNIFCSQYSFLFCLEIYYF